MNIVDEIKDIIFNFIEKEYQDYLNNKKILLIKENNIKEVINDVYEKNDKKLRNLIRSNLKDKYKENYPSGSVENIILDIFQDKKFNIEKTIRELLYIQNTNYKELTIPIINNTLNMNISLLNNYVLINSTNTQNIENSEILNIDCYKIIDDYKFLYSINKIILEEYDDTKKIEIIKENIKNVNKINIGIYYLKKNCIEN